MNHHSVRTVAQELGLTTFTRPKLRMANKLSEGRVFLCGGMSSALETGSSKILNACHQMLLTSIPLQAGKGSTQV